MDGLNPGAGAPVVPLVRRLRVDLDTPLPRHWNGGDAFRTALFNALSMSFPAGEQFFIDSLRMGVARLPAEQRAAWEDEVRGFIGQEATHRHVHARFNAHLAAQGLVNTWEGRILARRVPLEGVDARLWLGVTAATEHLTAVFAEVLLAQPTLLAGAEPRLRDLWLWHSSEETEHRSTAFDLYRALGGNERWRLRLFRVVSFYFATDLLRQTARNLWHSGAWKQAATWRSAWHTLLGRHGLLRHAWGPWRRYARADFHPAQADASAALAWLAAHGNIASPVTAR
jgi:predicted metal-dependent hydrolase